MPRNVERVYRKYSKDTSNKHKWAINAIAEPLYILGRHIYNLHASSGGTRFKSKAVGIATFFEFVTGIIDAVEAERKAKNSQMQAKIAKARSRRDAHRGVQFFR